ncbi:MAG: MFS transporter, partial [Alphaproteobacteria bacterium]
MIKITQWNKSQFSWAVFDWANQPFFTVVTTFIFAPYFTNVVIGNSVDGQATWGLLTAISAGAIAILSPIFGSIADVRGPRKPWVFMFSLVGAISCLGLWYAKPDENIYLPMLSFALATIAIEIACIFNNAMLPTIVEEKKMGKLSGFAWGIGYVGGLVPLFLLLFLFVWTDNPLFGLDKSAYEPERFSTIMAGAWLMTFTIPLLLFTKDVSKSVQKIPTMDVVKFGFSNLTDTIKSVKKYKNVWIFLIARSFYNDGILAVTSFAGIYAVATFNWDITGLGVFAIMVNIVAFFGCLVGGKFDDIIGSKRTINIFVIGLIISLLGVISITNSSVLFGLITFPAKTDGSFMTSVGEYWFMSFGFLLGFCFGPAQSASRTMMARIT